MKKQISLQWKLTLLTALLMTCACLLLSYSISKSAILYMDEIENSIVTVFPQNAITKGDSDNASFYLSITGDLSGQIQNSQTEFWKNSLLVTVLIVIGSSILTYFIVGYGLKPLKRLSRQIDEVQAGNIQQPLDIRKGSKEIAQLADVFNDMMQRLSEAFFMQKQFSANAAHELRTPLAIMQTRLEVSKKEGQLSEVEYNETMDMIQLQTERLSQLIDVLLEMTELQSAKRTDIISLSELVDECLCDLAAPADEKAVTLCQQSGDASVCGSYTLVYRAIYNLVENAIKYNRRRGRVEVKVVQRDDFASVIIKDTGFGIDDKETDKIFEPFYRVDKSRNRAVGGSGLGLALVREIARLHGGDVFVLDSSASGTEIELRLSS